MITWADILYAIRYLEELKLEPDRLFIKQSALDFLMSLDNSDYFSGAKADWKRTGAVPVIAGLHVVIIPEECDRSWWITDESGVEAPVCSCPSGPVGFNGVSATDYKPEPGTDTMRVWFKNQLVEGVPKRYCLQCHKPVPITHMFYQVLLRNMCAAPRQLALREMVERRQGLTYRWSKALRWGLWWTELKYRITHLGPYARRGQKDRPDPALYTKLFKATQVRVQPAKTLEEATGKEEARY